MLSTTTIALALAAVASAVPAKPLAPLYPRAANSSSDYSLVADYSGQTFFDQFTTFVGPDPTNGHVNYTDMRTAASKGLVGLIHDPSTNSSSAYIGVDHTNVAPNGRNSVRLISRQTFSAGSMAVIDVKHTPVQNGVWPAIWLLGSHNDWPMSGESDILEYVHETNYNGMTLHTGPDCVVSNVSTAEQQGRLLHGNCNEGKAATGCSVAAYDQNKIVGAGKMQSKVMATAGSSFNEQGGGIYVHDWQADGITVWMFPRGQLPSDLIAGKPNPASWKQKPLAKFAGSGCDFSTAFKDMQLILNIDFCGDWAGRVWESSGAAKKTGVETCNDYVANNPKVFEETYFDIASVKFYTKKGAKPGDGPVYSKRDEAEEPITFPSITPKGMPTPSPFRVPHFDASQPRYPNSTIGQHNCSTVNTTTHHASAFNMTTTASYNCTRVATATATAAPNSTVHVNLTRNIHPQSFVSSGASSTFAIGFYIFGGTLVLTWLGMVIRGFYLRRPQERIEEEKIE